MSTSETELERTVREFAEQQDLQSNLALAALAAELARQRKTGTRLAWELLERCHKEVASIHDSAPNGWLSTSKARDLLDAIHAEQKSLYVVRAAELARVFKPAPPEPEVEDPDYGF